MSNNKLIIESQNTGKTTYLLGEIKRLISENKNIIIMDSATEHESKSLLKQVLREYKNSICIEINDSNLIDINKLTYSEYINEFNKHFPFNEITNNQNKIICFDLSFFLEKGHDIFDKTQDIKLYKYYRELYNNLAQQIAIIIILCERYGIINDVTIVTDEIEFPIVDYDMSLLQKNISFISSVHPENAFGTFYKSFEKVKFKAYQKRKD